jgi:hypothetical protein
VQVQQHAQRQQQTQQHVQQQRQSGRFAQSGQRDNRGHEYNASRFGSGNSRRFSQGEGREYNGRHEVSFGGYWFYASYYPSWFYDCDSYFIMDPDGLWFAVSDCDPTLMFEVEID